MKKILGIGNALVDIMTLINDDDILAEFSLPKGSMQLVDASGSERIKAETKNFQKKLSQGGSIANTIHGLAMLGAGAGFIGSVGRDETGDIFENEMKKAGVMTYLSRHDSPTGTAITLVSGDSERTFATHLGAAVEFNAADLDPEIFKKFDILYIEGYLISDFRLVETACRIAREQNMTIALDLASYNVVESYLNEFRTIVKDYVDILFANEDEARVFTGLEPVEALAEMAGYTMISVVKTGPAGSWLRQNDEIIKVDPLPVKCEDTTGAGDLYACGFLYGFAKNLGLEKCGVLGSVMAGNVIETVGTKIPGEKWPSIRKYISVLSGENSGKEQ
ncbi:MAG TPA: adenosine kinase [Bacteroidales bacterium]|jgi:sugar/nucleoside kinase (ribokinase family)|nr:adenosine kinase [Bacteroidales bacterium]HOS71202.1 adenosine kinase [Bacteroidales bacterium]HQH24414.1 adenosine kinase [Bacteroidales bacterium]HQJ81453.1 adenosine kinase [Bacteroidales bacterium]